MNNETMANSKSANRQIGKSANGEWRIANRQIGKSANGEWRMANGEWRMANRESANPQIANRGWQMMGMERADGASR
jgi:hypothetical protein